VDSDTEWEVQYPDKIVVLISSPDWGKGTMSITESLAEPKAGP
jgi:hypothetical protein